DEAAAERVQEEEKRDLRDDRAACGRKLVEGDWRRTGRALRQSRVEDRRGAIEHAEKAQGKAHRFQGRERELRLEQRGRCGEEAADRVAGVEEDVVPGEDARAVGVGGGRGEE